MKILVIGSGGREHAIAWRVAQSPSVQKVMISPGNPGAARVAEVVAASSLDEWVQAAREKDADLVVVGPEAPLVAGLVDRLRAEGIAAVGPTAAAAEIEGSKSFAKQVMVRAGVPTARYRTVTTHQDAVDALDEFGFPVVLKADGLAAGKGVVVAQDRAEALAALPSLLKGRLVVEEFLRGREVSFIALCDGSNVVPLQATQDHKAAFDGDRGPNTGGMGAYRDSSILSPEQVDAVMRTIIHPTVNQMAADGRPFTGFLYAGLMMTSDGPRVLEYNARLGDPETQPLMHGVATDFAEVLAACAHGELGAVKQLEWQGGASVCVVLAAHGYPGSVRTGDVIDGIDRAEADGAVVFHAGTRQTDRGLETAGGRVLGVTASGADLRTAIDAAYAAARQVRFEGMHYRTDIGAKGLAQG